MRLTTALWLCAALIFTTAPAAAAELPNDGSNGAARMAAFAGARLRVPLGPRGAEKARAGLALTSSLRSADGTRTRFAKGLELGFAGDEAPGLALSGVPVSQLAQGAPGPDGRKLGMSTIGWVAIGVGVAAAAFFTVVQLCADGEICGSE